MADQDTFRLLREDVEARRIDRRTFLERATALGMSAPAMTAVLGAAGVAVPVGVSAAALQNDAVTRFSLAVSSDPETLDPQDTANSAA